VPDEEVVPDGEGVVAGVVEAGALGVLVVVSFFAPDDSPVSPAGGFILSE
jgi:hypothetical protein